MNFFKTFAALLMFFAFITSTSSADAQINFSHTGSGAFFFGKGVTAPGIVYSPRINIVELGDNANISVGSHLGLGFSFSGGVDSQSGASSSSSFLLDLPVVAEINIGHAKDNDNHSGFGFFAGGGFSYNRMSVSVDGFGIRGKTFGPLINAGARFPVIGRSWTARASFLIGLTQTKHNVFSIGIGTNFGMD